MLGCKDGTNVGSDFTDEQLEFLKAMDRFMAKTKKRFPTFVDVLEVAKSLGYQKVVQPLTHEDVHLYHGYAVM